MKRKIQTLYWFLMRPSLYPHLIHRLSKELLPGNTKLNQTREEMLHWCSENSVTTDIALLQITGQKTLPSIHHLFPEHLKQAEERRAACPVQMGGPGNLDLLFWCAEYLQATNVIETGVAYGWSSLAILLSLRNRKRAQLISTDIPYRRLNNEPYVGCVVPDDLKAQWRIIKHPDRQALPKAIESIRYIDMCHYDSDKSYDGRMWAYMLLMRSLRPGGILISDDIDDNVAFRDFTKTMGIKPTVVKKGSTFVGILIKPHL